MNTLKHWSALAASVMMVLTADARPTPVGTAFTYQGQLKQGGNNVNATADFQFTLFDVPAGGAPIAATAPANGVTISNGLFTVDLDFGAGVFGSEARWLDIAVRSPAGGGAFTTLTPRQAIVPTPVAQHALSVNGATITNLNASNIASGTLPSSTLSGTYSGAVNFTHPGNIFGGAAFNGSGAGLNNLNAGNISSGTLPIARGGTGATTATAALTNLNAQARVTGAAPVGSYIRVINADGTVVTGLDADGGGTVTSVGTGTGLTGGPITSSGTISVANNGITNALLASDPNSMLKVSGGIMTANNVLNSAALAGSLNLTVNLPLNINPMLSLQQDGAGSAAAMRFRNASSNSFAFGITSGSQLALNYNANIDQTDLVRVSSDGRVGLGVLAPAFRLDLPNSATNSVGQGRANAWTTYSSIRWKEHVQTIPDALEKVMSLRGVYFDWKAAYRGDDEGHDIGFIAEEVGRVVPELVSWEDNGVDAKSLKYDRITALTVNAIQELRTEKDAEIAALRDRITVLEKMVNDVLEAQKRAKP